VLGPSRLAYNLGTETKAIENSLGIFVFKSMDAASAFACNERAGKRHNTQILMCDYPGKLSRRRRRYRLSEIVYLSRADLLAFFKVKHRKLWMTPRGTYTVSAVIPREVVKLW
jgi:hypothetical protein